jgi:hypothetical protein
MIDEARLNNESRKGIRRMEGVEIRLILKIMFPGREGGGDVVQFLRYWLALCSAAGPFAGLPAAPVYPSEMELIPTAGNQRENSCEGALDPPGQKHTANVGKQPFRYLPLASCAAHWICRGQIPRSSIGRNLKVTSLLLTM